jgi:hypothetical protein
VLCWKCHRDAHDISYRHCIEYLLRKTATHLLLRHVIHCVPYVSRPLLQFAMWRYWFRLSRYVYGGNRSFAPILRQSWWSLLYDVY